jgi:hypothetical protein
MRRPAGKNKEMGPVTPDLEQEAQEARDKAVQHQILDTLALYSSGLRMGQLYASVDCGVTYRVFRQVLNELTSREIVKEDHGIYRRAAR